MISVPIRNDTASTAGFVKRGVEVVENGATALDALVVGVRRHGNAGDQAGDAGRLRPSKLSVLGGDVVHNLCNRLKGGVGEADALAERLICSFFLSSLAGHPSISPLCMDRLPFASEMAQDSGSRLYVSGLFDLLAGRGLDGEYARTFGLITGSATEEPNEAPDSECVYSSVPCLSHRELATADPG
jgi:hypothetical protein